jgi:type IV secretion system protein VirB3
VDLARFPVHRALTRPQMFGGVTFSFFIVNFTLTTEAFLISKSLYIIPLPFLIHAVGYIACLREPRVFDLWITKVSKCPRVRNWQRWGCNSYAA